MPPKAAPPPSKAKSSKGSPKGTGKGSPKGSPEQTLTSLSEDLNLRLQSLEADKKAAEEAGNYMQLERDKICSFWEITKAELREAQAELRKKDRDAEDAEDKHRVEIKVYKQKVKHLLYEHQNNIATLKIEAETAVRDAVQACNAQQAALLEGKAALKQQLREQRAEAEEALLRARTEAAKEVSKLRIETAATAKELAAAHDARLAAMQDEADATHKREAQAIEDAKNAHIQELIKDHKKAYESMRAYFRDITTNTLDLVKALKSDAVELKKREAAAEAVAIELAQENKRLVDPLAQAQMEADEMRAKLTAIEDTATRLNASRARLSAAERCIKGLEWKNEVLEQHQDLLQNNLRQAGMLGSPAECS